MPKSPNSTVVTITDRNYFYGVYALVLSLKYFRVNTIIHVLGIDLTADQVHWFEQYPDVRVFPADLANQRTAAARKAEAILTAAENDTAYISLLDGDCVVTGDLTPFLCPQGKALFARLKTDAEDRRVFDLRRSEEDRQLAPDQPIPPSILDVWRQDVGENTECRIRNTVCGGNLTVHRDYLDFVERWQWQIEKVLPNEPGLPHNWNYFAYFQTDESVLNSLLAFAADVPPVKRGQLDLKKEPHVAHLGPNKPKPWVCWRHDRVKYLPLVLDCLDWARAEGCELPPLPWSYRRNLKPLIYGGAWCFGLYYGARYLARRGVNRVTGRE